MSVSIKVLVISVTVLISLYETQATKCYVCQDCDSTYNSTHLIDCKPRQDRCIKMELMNGHVDRACADKKKCSGRDAPRRTRSINPRSISAIIDARTDELIVGPPKRRPVRQLLQSPSSSSSNSNSNKNNNNKKPAPDPGELEIKTLHCCGGDECNGVPATHQTIYCLLMAFLVVPYFL